jgi:hypothetical protein
MLQYSIVRKVIMKVFLGIVLLGSLAACGSDQYPTNDNEVNSSEEQRARVEECYNSGGEPKYTSNENGFVVQYLGCVVP